MLIGFAVVAILISYKFIENKSSKINTYDIIKNKIDSKSTFLIYITNDDSYQCSNCAAIDKIIDFYNEVYHLKFMEYNTNKNSKGDLIKLDKDFGFQDDYLSAPAVVIIKNGRILAVANEMTSDNILKQYLVDYQFIDSKSFEIETDLNTEESFNSIYHKEENSLIVIASQDINFKKKMYNLAIKNNFNYYTIYSGVMNYYSSYNILSSEIGYYLKTPSFVVVSNGKVVDYMKEEKEEKIQEFLIRNKIIS